MRRLGVLVAALAAVSACGGGGPNYKNAATLEASLKATAQGELAQGGAPATGASIQGVRCTATGTTRRSAWRSRGSWMPWEEDTPGTSSTWRWRSAPG